MKKAFCQFLLHTDVPVAARGAVLSGAALSLLASAYAMLSYSEYT
jgi:hypothetical protein